MGKTGPNKFNRFLEENIHNLKQQFQNEQSKEESNFTVDIGKVTSWKLRKYLKSISPKWKYKDWRLEAKTIWINLPAPKNSFPS